MVIKDVFVWNMEPKNESRRLIFICTYSNDTILSAQWLLQVIYIQTLIDDARVHQARKSFRRRGSKGSLDGWVQKRNFAIVEERVEQMI